MIKTYKILAELFDYPIDETVLLLPSIVTIAQEEALLHTHELKLLQRFVTDMKSQSLINWQATYVQTFDQSKTVNLYLFDHLYGDSKDRGMAMVDLKTMYASKGMEITSGELPDYLPLFLEYLSSLQSPQEAIELLRHWREVLEKIAKALGEVHNSYHPLAIILLKMMDYK